MKRILWMMIVAVVALIASPAWAGPYLNTSAMLLDENFAAGRWVRANLGDKDLARAAHKMAQARNDVAARMIVPPEVREAHPHLLLSLAAMELAMDAAVQGQISNFIRQLQTSTGEAKTFKAVLKGAGFTLPELREASLHKQRRVPNEVRVTFALGSCVPASERFGPVCLESRRLPLRRPRSAPYLPDRRA